MEHADIILRGGSILDGTGAPEVTADVAVVKDKIAAIGDLSDWEADVVVDATGLQIAPAFIDMHTHSDLSALHNPDQVSMLFQGVGTQVVGNCGMAMALVTSDERFQFEQRWLRPHGIEVDWNDFGGHLERVERTGIATNYVPLVGHGTVRKCVMGYEKRIPTEAEFCQMEGMVAEAFDAGAWGLSTGLEYTPGRFAHTDEVTRLAKVAAKRGGFYATHLRDEADALVEATEEAIVIAEGAGLPLQLSHHKADGKRNWGKVNTTLAMVERKRAAGMDILLDQYPYLAYQTGMGVAFLPEWVQADDPKETLSKLADPSLRGAILAAMRERDHDWSCVVISNTPGRRDVQGRTVADLAAQEAKTGEEFVVDFYAAQKGFVSAAHFALSEDDLRTVMTYPQTMIGSDAVGTAPTGTMLQERPHPRSYGTFPRVLSRYVRETPVLKLEEAVFKMTGLPAKRMGWTDRGVLRPSAFADIVVFDFNQIVDLSDFDAPHQLSRGIAHLLVNGRFAIRDSQLTGVRSGRVLRKKQP